MKPLLIAAFMAITFHVLIFAIELPLAKPILPSTQSRPVAISLVQVEKKTNEPFEKPEKPMPQPRHRSKPDPPLVSAPVLPPKPAKKSITKQPKPLPEKFFISSASPIEPIAPLQAIAIEHPLYSETAQKQPSMASAERVSNPLPEPSTQPSAQAHPVTNKAPIKRFAPQPVYPSLARRRGYTGTVVLNLLIATDGTVGAVDVLQSSGHTILDRNAVEYIQKQWRFDPAIENGNAVEMWVEVPVRFVLQ